MADTMLSEFAGRVWGGCVEPEGMDLDDGRYGGACPRRDRPAVRWHVERADGSINVHTGLRCDACGHHGGDNPWNRS